MDKLISDSSEQYMQYDILKDSLPFQSMSQQIVKFNVGGVRYEVSMSLLDAYPKTMLATSASKQWHENPDGEIFIERDGKRFRLVLDYMRDGRVHLPIRASRDALLLDLEYYGFEDVSTADILGNPAAKFLYDQSTAWKQDLFKEWDESIAEHERMIVEHKHLIKQIKDSKSIIDAFMENKSFKLRIPGESGKTVFKDCNELLTLVGLCVVEEKFVSYRSLNELTFQQNFHHQAVYEVTLKLV
jgi:hypothetical protein